MNYCISSDPVGKGWSISSTCESDSTCASHVDPSHRVHYRSMDHPLKPRAKEADHSNGRRPTLTRFRLPAIRNDVV